MKYGQHVIKSVSVRSAAEIAQAINQKFGFVVVASDDDLQPGEILPSLTSRGRDDKSIQAEVTGLSNYEEYAEQAEFVGFDCTDCFKYYFRIELKPK